MIVNRSRFKGAYLLVACASTGLMSSTPVKADIPVNVLQVIETVQDPIAPIASEVVDEAASPQLKARCMLN